MKLLRTTGQLSGLLVCGLLLMSGTAAADELNLTKGAVSYQIQQLEAELGFRVFSRARRC